MKLGAVVIDSNNSEELSEFYRKLLGWSKEVQSSEGEKWIIVSGDAGDTPLVFQEVSDYQKPTWPSVDGQQQQMLHLDFYVRPEELESKVNHAISCGATLSEKQFFADHMKVFIDPLGHPFCIIAVPNSYW